MKKISDCPWVTVIVPVYNAEDLLDKCINSVLDQKYENIELILVDDGSTDDSGSICDSYARKNSNVKVIHQQNSGQGQARNVGILESTSTYLCFLDNDDSFPDPDVISDMICYIRDCDILVGMAGDSLRYGKGLFIDFGKEIQDWEKEGGVFCLLLRKGLYTGTVWAKLYRRELFINNNIFFSENYICEDEEITPKLYLSAKKISFINRNCYCRYHNEKSQTNIKNESTYFRKSRDRVLVSKKLLCYIDGLDLNDSNNKVIYKHICGLFIQGLSFMTNVKEKKNIQFLEQCVIENKDVLSKCKKYGFYKYYMVYMCVFLKQFWIIKLILKYKFSLKL